jgi:hypothetical protein
MFVEGFENVEKLIWVVFVVLIVSVPAGLAALQHYFPCCHTGENPGKDRLMLQYAGKYVQTRPSVVKSR